jgi:glucose/arabinose dehydrogenase/PKD repeat protein
MACAAITAAGVLVSAPNASADPPPRVPAAGDAPSFSQFQKVTLNDDPGEPMSLAVLPDLRVLHSARTGEIRVNDPRTGLNTLVADFKDGPKGLYQHDEEGLQGIAIDPNFSTNHWVYVYYSPRLDTPVDDPDTPLVNEGDAPMEGTLADFAPFRGYLQLSRFKLEDNMLDFASEQEILQVPVDRGNCCHVGGQIDFDSKGNLILSTGDDTNPFFSEGYSPIDDSDSKTPALDARRSSGNTNDLRGKILRITVGEDGGYTIPGGNLFGKGRPNTRPEIYAMGLRNPFRFAVNRETDDIYVGDYSPDSSEADPNRGPAGQGRWMSITKPGNYGWPFCATPELPYRDWDFATHTAGEWFNCNHPINDSKWNSDTSYNGTQITFQGLRHLPKVQWPDIWYGYAPSELFPEINGQPRQDGVGGNGVSPMGGPAYHYDAKSTSQTKWPAYYDDAVLFYEWSRDYIKDFRLDRKGDIVDIRDFGPVGLVDNPMDMEFGPDGSLYVLEYGDGYFSENPDAQLSRIDFTRGNRTPTVKVTADTAGGLPPLTVKFSSAGTSDPDGDTLRYQWDFDADGVVDSTEQNPTYTYTTNGVYNATLKITDSTGRWASDSVRVLVGNQPPKVELKVVPAGGTFDFGDAVQFTVTVTDDQPVDCARVNVSYILGHDQHGHPQSSTAGCSGTIQTPPLDEGHAASGNIAGVFVATYTDNPPGGQQSLEGSDEVVLRSGDPGNG